MIIDIWQTGCTDWKLALTHLIKLFDEEAECRFFTPEAHSEVLDGPAELTITLDLRMRANEAELTLKLHSASEETSFGEGEAFEWSERCVRPHELESASDGWRGMVKRMLFRTLLSGLQAYSGIVQPWGILTGVRPTKLAHQLLKTHTREQATTILMEEYLLTPEKAQLLTEIVDRQLQVIPDMYRLQREVSLYIGIPFCPTKCAYCTFPAYDIGQYREAVTPFLHALIQEIRATGKWLREKKLKVTTIYWGGGTPTSISAEQMDLLLEELKFHIPDYEKIRESTIEAGRPDTITVEKIDVLRKHAIDRMSINPQSFTQETLDKIGRHHTVAETIEAFRLCRAHGMGNINMDLIIGLPDEGVPAFTHSLEQVEQLLPQSLTVHTLSFKRASKMTKARDQYEVAERDEIGVMMDLAERWTVQHGYRPYYLYRQKNILGNLENVGYALPGYDSLYNILMMEEVQTIIGIGCGAVSKIIFHAGEAGAQDDQETRIERFANPKEPAQYNASWETYLQRKLKLLDEAYPEPATVGEEVSHEMARA